MASARAPDGRGPVAAPPSIDQNARDRDRPRAEQIQRASLSHAAGVSKAAPHPQQGRKLGLLTTLEGGGTTHHRGWVATISHADQSMTATK